MGISELITWFVLASVVGWLFESTYNVVRLRKWDKRGFLFGPICPIYGVGVVVAILLFDRPFVSEGAFPAWLVFLACVFGSAVMEYSVSVALEKLFGAVWWDYSDLPLNLNGRICLPASLLFGIAGLVVVYLLLPVLHVLDNAVLYTVFEIFALVAISAISADLVTTVVCLRDLMAKIVELDKGINARANEGIRSTAEAIEDLKGRLSDRQVKLLFHLRRFESEIVRKRALLLQASLQGALTGGMERWTQNRKYSTRDSMR